MFVSFLISREYTAILLQCYYLSDVDRKVWKKLGCSFSLVSLALFKVSDSYIFFIQPNPETV